MEGVPNGFQYLDTIRDEREEASIPRGKSLAWEVYGPASPHSISLDDPTARTVHQTLKRQLGPTEVSYYLGSRGDGVNDMYLHIGFRAPSSLMTPSRLLRIWSQQLSKHTLLASQVEFGGYHDISFRYDPPKNDMDARKLAEDRMEIRTNQDPKQFLDNYLNGPRTLSDQILSKLIISTPSPSFSTTGEEEQEYDYYLLSTHFLGDGMALHTTANEFFNLLATFEEKKSDERSEMRERDEVQVGEMAMAMESKIAVKGEKMAWAAKKVVHQNQLDRDIGGHAFPRAKLGPRHTLVPTISYDLPTTKRILTNCKTHGSTISHAVFALANLAYIRTMGEGDKRLPMMLYSALNVRGNLKKSLGKDEDGKEVRVGDWYHIAIGYYNITLPTFLPSTLTPSQTFWLRALSTRTQTSRIVKSPFINSRTLLMALEREERSIGFEMEDDRKREEGRKMSEMKGLGVEMEGLELKEKKEEVKKVVEEVREVKRVKVPSMALLGVSMLGNLDAMYTHAAFPSFKLHTLTTGSRQRPGAILLFAYTFAGKLWFSLGYDKNGFKDGVVDRWWEEVQSGVREFLVEEEKVIV